MACVLGRVLMLHTKTQKTILKKHREERQVLDLVKFFPGDKENRVRNTGTLCWF